MMKLKIKDSERQVCWMQSEERLMANCGSGKCCSSINPCRMNYLIRFSSSGKRRKKHVLQKLREDGTLNSDNEQLEITECVFSVDDPLSETAEWAILLSQKVGNADDIALPNVVLKFVEHDGGKDRLTDVVIGQTD